MSCKAQAAAFSTFSPGPDGAEPKAPAPTFLSARIRSSMSQAAPVDQFTPQQNWFRSSIADGRWQADYGTGAHAPVYRSRQDKDSGAVDVVRMEPFHDPDGADQYLDLGGRGGIDYGAVRA